MHSKVNETIAQMEHDHPGWKVWVIYPATGGVLWCARRATEDTAAFQAATTAELAADLADVS